MDYVPRYAQPFTLAEAASLEIQEITEEIARLQNSLLKLDETQDLLKAALKEEFDAVLLKALEENNTVIGSQQERIGMLKMALTQKGFIVSGTHYDVPESTRKKTGNQETSQPLSAEQGPREVREDGQIDGVFL